MSVVQPREIGGAPPEDSLVLGGNSALTKVRWGPDPGPPYGGQTSVLLVFLLRLAFCGPQVSPHLCVHQSPNEDTQGAQPVPQSERVLEVQDGKDEAHKLAESHNKCDGEGGAFCGEDEDASDAHILGDDIHEEVEPHDGHCHTNDWHLI